MVSVEFSAEIPPHPALSPTSLLKQIPIDYYSSIIVRLATASEDSRGASTGSRAATQGCPYGFARGAESSSLARRHEDVTNREAFSVAAVTPSGVTYHSNRIPARN